MPAGATQFASRPASRAGQRDESQAGAAREAGVQGFQPTDVQWPRRSRSALPLEPGQAEYPPFCTAAPISSELAPMTQIGMICVRLCVWPTLGRADEGKDDRARPAGTAAAST